MSNLIRFESRRVGPIEVDAERVMSFEPFPGFPGSRRFVVMEHAEESQMAWLASLDDADLAFVVANPWAFFPDYDPPVAREHLAALGIEKKEEVEILCLVTLSGRTIQLNLAAPLLINASTRKGIQVISDDATYSMRVPIPALEAKAEAASGETDGTSRGSGKQVPPAP